MSTSEQGFTLPTAGQADWDTDINANFQQLGKGYLGSFVASMNIGSGQVVCVNTQGLASLYDPKSLDAVPAAIATTVVSAGNQGYFTHRGYVSSVAVWSGTMIAGQHVYVDPRSPGVITQSHVGYLSRPVGICTAPDQILFSPTYEAKKTTELLSLSVLVGSAYDFVMAPGPRGFNRRLEVIARSLNAYKLQFWSGSSRVNSELVYATRTTSVNGGSQDYDVNTLYFLDGAGFPFEGTDTASRQNLYGRLTVQSASSVGSDFVQVRLISELVR